MKPVIWLIGGTSEGRRLIKELAKLPVELYVSVATDYGASLIEPQPGMTSWANPGQAVYLRENLSGETVQVGAFDPSLPGTANRMKPLPCLLYTSPSPRD